jgi:dienelactone hydrolase
VIEATRDAILERLGRIPGRTPLDAALGSPIDGGDHTRTLVTYTVEPGERVAAWLLRPSGATPEGGWPGLLAIHQHAGEYHLGKSEPAGLTANPMYHYGLDLCRRGYAVLCPDHLCFEDRRPDAAVRAANPHLDGERYETFEFTRRLLMGSSLQAKYLHDLRCALDVLAGLPYVDADRLGAAGHSLGGQETLWLMWFDDRLRAGFSSCGFAPIRAILAAGINHNKAMYVPGLLELCDVDDLVVSLAPRPFMLSAGERDLIFPIVSVHQLCARAREAYGRTSASDCFQAAIFPEGHSLPDAIKERAYEFLDQHLKRP